MLPMQLALLPVAALALSLLPNARGAQTSELPAAGSEPGRVVVVVLYGANAVLVERGMESGRLRHLAALRDAGTRVEVVSSLPNDTPTLWAGLATGADRLQTLVPGFSGVERTGRLVLPRIGYMEQSDEAIRAAVEEREDGLQAPVELAQSLVGGVPFWEHTAEAGVPTVVLRAGMADGRPATEGLRSLYGEGVLDATGLFGAWAVYTSHADERMRVPRGRRTPTAGSVYRVDLVEGRVETELFGPTDAVSIARLERELEALAEHESLAFDRTNELGEALQERLSALRERPASLPLTIEPKGDEARVTIDGTSQALAEGDWSEPFRLRFELDSGFTVAARTRVKLLSLQDPLRLYVDSLDVDPPAAPPWAPLGSPASFVAELAEVVGPFDTYGQGASATMGVKDGELDAQTLLEDVEHTLRNAERLTQAVLERDDWRLLVTTFTAADRAGVVLMHHADPTHPLHEGFSLNYFTYNGFFHWLVALAHGTLGDRARYLRAKGRGGVRHLESAPGRGHEISARNAALVRRDDRTLILRAQGGDATAFGDLVERCAAAIGWHVEDSC